MSHFGLERIETEPRDIPKPPGSLSVLHWNVWHKAEPSEIVDTLATTDADIMCLHELSLDSSHHPAENVAEKVRDELGVDGFVQEVHHLRGKRSGTFARDGVAILSRLPLLSALSVTLSEGGWDMKYQGDGYRRKYTEATITPPGRPPLTVGTVHLSLPQAAIGNPGVRRSETTRLSDIVREQHERFVLTGDFNTSAWGPSVRSMGELLVRMDGALATTTWHLGNVGLKRMDYIFTTPDIDVTGARILPRGPSDHNPIEIYIR